MLKPRQTVTTGFRKLLRSDFGQWSICESLIMEKLPLPADFKDFLQLLNSAKVEYLLVGGYAVGHYRRHGHMDCRHAE